MKDKKEQEKLPLKIKADNLEKFAQMEALMRRLPEDFLKQFETVEEWISNKFEGKDEYGEKKFKVIGRIQSFAQSGETRKTGFSSPTILRKYEIFTRITVDGKEECLILYFYLSEGVKFQFECEANEKNYLKPLPASSAQA